MDAFDRLDPRLQKIIYNRLGWRDFRPIQKAAIEAVFTHHGDLLISAPTAAGKTEAVILPLISKCHQEPGHSVRILYISPLKALMNNQERRFLQLCPDNTLPVTVWHADASSSGKARLRRKPDGILIITPESLEALVDAPEGHPEQIFAETSYVVIDEIHALAGSTRGTHLLSLLRRLEFLLARKFSIFGLSATMSNPLDCARWLRPHDPDRVLILADDGAGSVTAITSGGSKLVTARSTAERPLMRGRIYAWDFSTIGDNVTQEHAAPKAEEQDAKETTDEILGSDSQANFSFDDGVNGNGDKRIKSTGNINIDNNNNNKTSAFKICLSSELERLFNDLLKEQRKAHSSGYSLEDSLAQSSEKRSDTVAYKAADSAASCDSTDVNETPASGPEKMSKELEYSLEILKKAKGKKVLAFVNSRILLERIYELLKLVIRYHKPFESMVVVRHHGLMSAQERHDSERILTQAQNGALVLCTSTLELGIDIGDVDEVFFLSAPFSVSSFLQRLGRSGRRQGEIPTFRFFLALNGFTYNLKGEKAALHSRLYLELARACALVRLGLKRRPEPLTGLFPDASTFVQQILSFIASRRETTLPAIFSCIGRAAFAEYFSKNDFVAIMKHLILSPKPLIAQNSQGTVYLTRQGELFCEDKEFYCSFASERVMELREGNRLVACIPVQGLSSMMPGQVLHIGDNFWEMLKIEEERIEVKRSIEVAEYLEPSLGGNGNINIYEELAWETGTVLADAPHESYLSPEADLLLTKASKLAWTHEDAGFVFFVWAGSRVLATIFLLLRHALPMESFVRTDIYIRSKSLESAGYADELGGMTPKEVMISSLMDLDITEELLLEAIEVLPVNARRLHKFDDLLPQYIIDREFVRRCLDIEGTRRYLKTAFSGNAQCMTEDESISGEDSSRKSNSEF